jgi:hypothetical protein
VLDEDLATLFFDGELVLDRVKITRSRGSFGIALFSSTPDARCDGRDIWVWTWE